MARYLGKAVEQIELQTNESISDSSTVFAFLSAYNHVNVIYFIKFVEKPAIVEMTGKRILIF